jgi:hypothetical protein
MSCIVVRMLSCVLWNLFFFGDSFFVLQCFVLFLLLRRPGVLYTHMPVTTVFFFLFIVISSLLHHPIPTTHRSAVLVSWLRFATCPDHTSSRGSSVLFFFVSSLKKNTCRSRISACFVVVRLVRAEVQSMICGCEYQGKLYRHEWDIQFVLHPWSAVMRAGGRCAGIDRIHRLLLCTVDDCLLRYRTWTVPWGVSNTGEAMEGKRGGGGPCWDWGAEQYGGECREYFEMYPIVFWHVLSRVRLNRRILKRTSIPLFCTNGNKK